MFSLWLRMSLYQVTFTVSYLGSFVTGLLSGFSCDISYLGSIVRNISILQNDSWWLDVWHVAMGQTFSFPCSTLVEELTNSQQWPLLLLSETYGTEFGNMIFILDLPFKNLISFFLRWGLSFFLSADNYTVFVKIFSVVGRSQKAETIAFSICRLPHGAQCNFTSTLFIRGSVHTCWLIYC